MSDLVKELEALDAKATKGPWGAPIPEIMSGEFVGGSGIHGEHGQGIVEAIGYVGQPVLDDLLLVVSLRNALPALIEYVKAQDAVWEACEGAPIYAAKRLESAEAALLAALRGGK